MSERMHPAERVFAGRRHTSRRDEQGLTPVSYALLGALATKGPQTPYQLKKLVAETLGYFWSFSQGSIYSEPKRLASAGFVTEEQEEGSRRRRVLAITDAGRDALATWFAEPTETTREIRDIGMMKLFFSEVAEPDAIRSLIAQQRAVHEEMLEQIRESRRLFVGRHNLGNRPITIEMGLLWEEAAVEFWSNLEIDDEGQLRLSDGIQARREAQD